MKKFPEFTQLKHRRAGLLMNEKEIKSLVASWFKEDDQKLDKLCEIFGIKDESIDKYKLLSLELARKFLPKKKKSVGLVVFLRRRGKVNVLQPMR